MNQVKADVRALFQWEDPAVLRLTEEIFAKCILGKIFPPEGDLKQNWIAPGGCYRGQWIWDTMFVVDLLSIVPDTEETIRDVFQNYWDFQARWNRDMPDYAHDMVACAILPPTGYTQYTQIPTMAWGLERVYRRNGDKQLVAQSLAPLEKYHDWYWRERDVTNVNLVGVGTYGNNLGNPDWDDVQCARFETFDFECNLDDLKLTKHPTRLGEHEGPWYGDICLPGISSYLILAEKCLARLAEIMGDNEMARRRRARADKGTEAMRTHMWDEGTGLFLAVKRDTLEKIPVATIGSWIPLHAGIPTKKQAERMAEALQSENWQTPLPLPTVDRQDPRYRSNGFWRGDVWPPTNYQVADGLAAYGYKELAAVIADKTIANALMNGINERYDSISGKGLGVDFLGMSGVMVTMMLEGLSKAYRLRIRTD
ncbi:MAG: trehalase family glycosidase [bacterium]